MSATYLYNAKGRVLDNRPTIFGDTNPNFGKSFVTDGTPCQKCGCKTCDCVVEDGLPGWIQARVGLFEVCNCGSVGIDGVEVFIKWQIPLNWFSTVWSMCRRANYTLGGGGSGSGGPCKYTWECVKDLSCISDYVFYSDSACTEKITDMPYNLVAVASLQILPQTSGTCAAPWDGLFILGIRRATDPDAMDDFGSIEPFRFGTFFFREFNDFGGPGLCSSGPTSSAPAFPWDPFTISLFGCGEGGAHVTCAELAPSFSTNEAVVSLYSCDAPPPP